MANSYYQRKATFDAVKAHKPEALRRDEQTDYTSGYFFVTLNVRDHKPLLGTISGQVDDNTRRVSDVNLCLSKLGEAVQDCWQSIPRFHPNVTVLESVVMPEHFHGLLRIEPAEGITLGLAIKGFKIGCNREYKKLFSLQSASLFSSGYNETIPVNPDEVETKRLYIRSNPERRLIKEHFRDLFTIVRAQHSPHWTMERIALGLGSNRNDSVRPRLLTDAGRLALDYIGSRDLLLGHKLPLVCHRADANRFAEQSAAVLRAAKDGAVIVSAFISAKEREILNQLLEMKAPVIEIVDNGFGKTYKPWGKSFYACVDARLLQITPWNYLYQRDFVISRPMCLVMNELARLISGVADDWWKS